jgi:hypothetical protein
MSAPANSFRGFRHLGRVSAAEYFQGAFGQKGSFKRYGTAITFLACPNRYGPRSHPRPLTLFGLETVSCQNTMRSTSDATQHVGVTILPRWGFESGSVTSRNRQPPTIMRGSHTPLLVRATSNPR